MSLKVQKAVIPAAGWGTRFLPVTKSCPKELLPIVDHPSIFYVIQEAAKAGITEIILVISDNKKLVEEFFTPNGALNAYLESNDKLNLLDSLNSLIEGLKFTYVEQKEALGLGHAVLCAKEAVAGEPFAVLLPDEIEIADKKNSTEQLVKNFKLTGLSTISIMEVPKEEVFRYGIAEVENLFENRFKVKSLVEKPAVEEAPSQLALPGRYVFDPEIFNILETTPKGSGGEVQLTDAMITLAKAKGLEALITHTRRFDTGNTLGFLKANIEFNLENKEIRSELKKYMENLCQKL